jgi:hypothetical protein
MPAAATCHLKIIRRGGYADALRSYKIFINGEQVCSIARNATLALDAPSGPLKIEARVDWGKSFPLTIEAAPNQSIEIEVSNHWGALLSLWAITFGYRSYLILKQV